MKPEQPSPNNLSLILSHTIILIIHIYPTPPLGQDITQEFLNEVLTDLNT